MSKTMIFTNSECPYTKWFVQLLLAIFLIMAIVAAMVFADPPLRVSHKTEPKKIQYHEPAERAQASEAINDLLKKTDGLHYYSESDELIEVFVRPIRSNEKLTKLLVEDWGANGNDKILQVEGLGSWFKQWAEQAEGYDVKDGARVQDVASFFTNKTKGAKAFRINEGKVRVTIIVVGQLGNYFVGIRTVSTET